MKYLEDGFGGSPTSSLTQASDPDEVISDQQSRAEARAAKREQRALRRQLRQVDIPTLVGFAQVKDAKGDMALDELLSRLLDDIKIMSAKSAKHSIGSDNDKEINAHGEAYRDGQQIGYLLLVDALRGEGWKQYTGTDSHGNPILFEAHFRWAFKKLLADFRFKESTSGRYSRRHRNRWESLVVLHSDVGAVTMQAIDAAREAVKRGDYKNTELAMKVEKFDACTEDYFNDRQAVSLDKPFSDDEDDADVTVADTIVQTVFSLPETTPEQQIASEALERLPERKRQMFMRATGLIGEKELLADIAKDYGITEQGVGYNVLGVKKFLASCIEEYRFAAGLPAMKMQPPSVML